MAFLLALVYQLRMLIAHAHCLVKYIPGSMHNNKNHHHHHQLISTIKAARVPEFRYARNAL